MPQGDAQGAGVGDWRTAPFRRFLEYVEEETRLVSLAASGIRQITSGDQLAEALAQYNAVSEKGTAEEDAELVEIARERATLAREEVAKDFRLLHAHSLMSIWGALEVLVEEVAYGWLSHEPELLAQESLAAIKVSLADFYSMTDEERLRFLVSQVVHRSGARGGYPRMEEILRVVGYGGGPDEKTRRGLLEAYAVRNVFAHRAGIADRKLLDDCPWRADWILGQPVPFGSGQYAAIMSVIHEYVTQLIYRSGDKANLPLREMVATIGRNAGVSE